MTSSEYERLHRDTEYGVIDRETIHMKRNGGVALLRWNSVQPALESFQESLALVKQKLATSAYVNAFSSCTESQSRLVEQIGFP